MVTSGTTVGEYSEGSWLGWVVELEVQANRGSLALGRLALGARRRGSDSLGIALLPPALRCAALHARLVG